MVDPITATFATTLLVSFLSHAGEGFSKRFGEKVADKAAEASHLIAETLKADEYGGLTLLRLQESPMDENRQLATELVLKEKIDEDPMFGQRLRHMIEEIRQLDGGSAAIAIGERSIAIKGDVTSSFINTGDITRNDG